MLTKTPTARLSASRPAYPQGHCPGSRVQFQSDSISRLHRFCNACNMGVGPVRGVTTLQHCAPHNKHHHHHQKDGCYQLPAICQTLARQQAIHHPTNRNGGCHPLTCWGSHNKGSSATPYFRQRLSKDCEVKNFLNECCTSVFWARGKGRWRHRWRLGSKKSVLNRPLIFEISK